jgi:hypothetical protein
MAKVLTATTRAEEYELRATYLKDDHELSGDGPRDAEFRINKALRLVPFSPNDRVLDISPGKALLFERIHERVKECHGHDIAQALVERVAKKFQNRPTVSFTCGPPFKLPYADKYFDKVLMTGAFCLQESLDECRQTLAEIRRVAKDSAVIFISDNMVVDESKLAPEHVPFAKRLMRRLTQDGLFGFPASVARFVLRKIRVVLGVEPVIIPSNHGTLVEDAVFLEMCKQTRLTAKGFPTEMITGTSRTRRDYLITPAPLP